MNEEVLALLEGPTAFHRTTMMMTFKTDVWSYGGNQRKVAGSDQGFYFWSRLDIHHIKEEKLPEKA